MLTYLKNIVILCFFCWLHCPYCALLWRRYSRGHYITLDNYKFKKTVKTVIYTVIRIK